MADTPDFGALAQSDYGYAASHGANRNTILDLVRQFGQSSALSPQEAAAYGITPADLAGVDDNPYSTVKNLAKTLIQNNYGITNNAAAHGAEFSGAHQAQLLGERDAGAQRNYDATQGLTSSILGVDTADAGEFGTAATNLANNYVPPPPPAPAPAAPAPAAAPPLTGYLPGPTAGPTTFDGPKGQEVAVKPIPVPRPPKIVVGRAGGNQ